MIARSLLFAALAASPLSASALDWHAGIGIAGELDGRINRLSGERVDGDEGKLFVVGATHASGFGIEAGYADLGRLRASGIADGGFDVDGELWTVGATYTVGDGPFRPYAKLGWFDREDSGTATTIAGPVAFRVDDDGLHAEVGARWRLGERFAVRGGYAWYDFDNGSEGSVQLLAELHF